MATDNGKDLSTMETSVLEPHQHLRSGQANTQLLQKATMKMVQLGICLENDNVDEMSPASFSYS